MILASVLGLGLVSLGLIGAQTDGSGADLELLKRLFSPPGEEPRIVEIALGRLPEAWPAEIPIPEEAELIGGLAHSDGTVQVRFSVSWDPETLALFYRQALVSKGWSPSEAAPAYLPGFCLCRGNEAVFVVAARRGLIPRLPSTTTLRTPSVPQKMANGVCSRSLCTERPSAVAGEGLLDRR